MVYNIDVGMSNGVMGGAPAALLIHNDSVVTTVQAQQAETKAARGASAEA
jgi:hypothetical protein